MPGHLHLAVSETEGQRSFEDVPGFIIRMVDMQVIGSAAAPFVEFKGIAIDINPRMVIQLPPIWEDDNRTGHGLRPSLA